ncbi:MAG: MarR family transcriptional regulator [Paracoccaceae bacterium]|nr:MAG: MarR family transcriptional regulator [Paracoccaceae bacterium]
MLCFALYSATHAMQAVYAPLLEPLGLTYPQYLVLSALWQKDGQGVGELGRGLGLESNTLTPILKRMAAAGLILRDRDAADERRVTVRLADRGEALRAHAGPIAACVRERTGLAQDALAELQTQVSRLRDTLRTPPAA